MHKPTDERSVDIIVDGLASLKLFKKEVDFYGPLIDNRADYGDGSAKKRQFLKMSVTSASPTLVSISYT